MKPNGYIMKIYFILNLMILIWLHRCLCPFVEIWSNFKKFDSSKKLEVHSFVDGGSTIMLNVRRKAH